MAASIIVHPSYGSVEVGAWLPVYVHDVADAAATKCPGYEIMFTEQSAEIRRNGGHVIAVGGRDSRVCMYGSRWSTTHVMLASAFPSVKRDDHADHIDNCHTNNRIDNLQWLSAKWLWA